MAFKRHNIILFTSSAGVILLYIITRCLNFTSLPYFGDEAEYVWYGQTALHDPSQRFISLEVGKQPLFVWFVMLAVKIFSNPLIAGRMVSIAAGLLTMFGIWFLTYRLFRDKQVAFFSALLFVFFPFAQLINRLGNYDSVVGMFYVWCLYFTVLLVQTIRLDVAYTLGLFLAGGILTKTNAFFSLYLLPFSLLLFNFKKLERWHRLAKFLVLLLFTTIIANACYLILQLSPFYERILWFNGNFVYPKREWLALSIPFRINLFVTNFNTMLPYLFLYITPPYILLLFSSVFFSAKQRRITLLLLAYFFLPIFALGMFGKGISSRWIYPYTLPLLPLMAWGLMALIQKTKLLVPKKRAYIPVTVLLLLFMAYPAFEVFTLAIRPYNAHIPAIDKYQYITSAYWGLRDNVMPYLKAQSQGKMIFVGTGGLKGTPQAIELYAYPQNNIKTKGYLFWDTTYNKDVKDLISHSSHMPTYFVGKGLTKTNPHIKLIKRVPCEIPDGSPCSIPIYQVSSN
jgi:4-amino-4-deoxy-L-arabinose transferase-like glycosyltransferase